MVGLSEIEDKSTTWTGTREGKSELTARAYGRADTSTMGACLAPPLISEDDNNLGERD
jgi:hypothetical protein